MPTHVTWYNLTHWYQPPWQKKEIVDQVTRECYRPMSELLLQYPQLSMSINVTGTLIELLRPSHTDVLDALKRCWERGQIEIVGSAYGHALLPLIPESEIHRQIQLQEELLKSWLGDAWSPKGFYAPELAYHPKVMRVLKARGYTWVVLDEITVDGKLPEHRLALKDGVICIFRERKYSRDYPLKHLINEQGKAQLDMMLTATDVEMYGHYNPSFALWNNIATHPEVSMHSLSEYARIFPAQPSVRLRLSAGETQERHIEAGVPFPYWKDKGNAVHTTYLRMMEVSRSIVDEQPHDPMYADARKRVDWGESSCALWWGSNAQPHGTSPVLWNPDDILGGAHELIVAVRSMRHAKREDRLRAEKLYRTLLKHVWEQHWSQRESGV